MSEKLDLIKQYAVDTQVELDHWNDKLKKERMRYVKWLRKTDPLRSKLTDLERLYSEIATYNEIVTDRLKAYSYIWE